MSSSYDDSSFYDDVLEPGERPIRKRRTWLILIVLVMVAAATFVGAHRYATDRVPLGTSVEGVSVGGLTRAQAIDRLRARLGERLSTPVEVTHNDRTYRLDAAESGFSIDYDATLRDVGAAKSRWSPADVWAFYTNGGDHDAVLRVDKVRFEQSLVTLAKQIGRTAVEGTVAFDHGRARPVYGRTGLAIDEGAAIQLVRSLVFADHPGELPMAVRRPYVSATAVRTAMRTFGQKAMSGPVTVDIGGHRFRIGPARFGRAITMVPSAGKLVPLVDGAYLHRVLAPAMPTIGDKPEDATVRLRRGAPHVVPAVFGAAYDDDALATAFVRALTKSGDRRIAKVHAAITAPDVSTAKARSWGISTRETQLVVKTPSSALAPMDQLVVGPSAVRVSDVLGSADRASVSAVFLAAIRAGIDVPTFTAPTRPVRGLPLGRQAVDAQIGGSGHYLFSVRKLGSLQSVVTVWGPEQPRVGLTVSGRTHATTAPVETSTDAGCTPRQGRPGFTVEVRRTGPGTPSVFASTYAPVAEIRCDSHP